MPRSRTNIATLSAAAVTIASCLDALRQDARFSLRLVRRSPLFFGAAMLTLALGIGANGAVFSILQSVLLQPLPYDDPSRLAMLWHADVREAVSASSDRYRDRLEFSGPMAISVRDATAGALGETAAAMVTQTGGQIGATQGDHLDSALDLVVGDRAVRLNGATVTPNFFRVLGVRAAIGRVFDDGDDATSAAPIILSDATWRRDFGADANIVGRAVTISSGLPRVAATFTVIGVLPRGVQFTYPDEVEAWSVMPWTAVARSDPYAVGEFMLLSRIRPGLSIDQARQLLSTLPRPPLVAPANARGAANDRVGLLPTRDWIVGDTRPSLYLLGGVAALLLLVTCLTVSNGLLARFAERQQELAVRSALGAGRLRLLQQLLVEGTFLAIGGTVAGTVLAMLIGPVMRGLLPLSLPRVGEPGMSGSVALFGAVMAAVTTMLSAVAPAWGGTRQDASSLTRVSSGATASRSAVRWRHALVAAQAALTVMLLVFSTLLLTSLWRLGQVPLGFDPRNVLAVNLQLLEDQYRAPGAISGLQESVLRGVRGIPGVVSAGVTSAIPFRGFDSPAQINVMGSDRRDIVRVRHVDSAFFQVFRVPVLRGRLLGDEDRDGSAAVAVISASYARSVFGTSDPIGTVLDLDRPTRIVGVVGDLRYAGLEKDAAPAVYLPMLQHPRPIFTLVVRVNAWIARDGVIHGIRDVLHRLDPRLPALNIAMVDQVVDATITGRRFYSVASGAFAMIALTLTTIGLSLVVARAVAERRRELAVRAALGATNGKLVRAATGDALVAIAAGVVGGLLLASIGSDLLSQFLFRVGARSPVAYGGAAMLVIAVAGAAAWWPMRRFARTSLAGTLRQE